MAKVVENRQYDWFAETDDLVVVVESDDLVLYENRAFDEAPPPKTWPRAYPVMPWPAFLIATLHTGLTVSGSVGWRVANRWRRATGMVGWPGR